MPFGSAKQNVLVDALNQTVTAHYGHALPLFIQALLARRHLWESWQREYEVERARLAKQATNNVGTRLAAYAAAVTFTASLVHKVFTEAGYPLPWSYDDRLASVWETLLAEADEAAVDLRALEDVKSWAHSNSRRFYAKDETGVVGMVGSDSGFDPSGGWLGRVLPGERFAFFPDKLREYLDRQGYRDDEVVSGWRERGWLELDKEGKFKQVSWPPTKGKARMVALRAEAWAHGEGDEPTGEEQSDTSGQFTESTGASTHSTKGYATQDPGAAAANDGVPGEHETCSTGDHDAYWARYDGPDAGAQGYPDAEGEPPFPDEECPF
jgi:hypothetical protein